MNPSMTPPKKSSTNRLFVNVGARSPKATPKATAAAIASTAVLAAACFTPQAQAALVLTNGDFNTAPAADDDRDIIGWHDLDGPGGHWEETWLEVADSPNGTPALALSGIPANDNGGSWAYQSIGTADGLSELVVSFEFGSFADAGGPRDMGVTWSLFATDGFIPDQSVDVLGGAGTSLLDSASVSAEDIAIGGNAGMQSVTLDLSSAGNFELYLRVNNFEVNGQDEAWTWVDNVQLANVPEPAGLMALPALALLLQRRRRMA